MKTEIKDRNKLIRERIKVLEKEEDQAIGKNQAIGQQIQQLQQVIIRNNQEILKCQGGREELEKQLSN